MCTCIHIAFSVLRRVLFFQVSRNTLLQEALVICDPVLTEVAGNPFGTSGRWIGPGGLDSKT